MAKIVRPNTQPEISERMRTALFDEVRRRVREKFGITGYDPVIEMALIANDPELSKMYDLRLRANEKVAEYVHPKMNRVEVSGPDGGPIPTQDSGVSDLLKTIESLVRENGKAKE